MRFIVASFAAGAISALFAGTVSAAPMFYDDEVNFGSAASSVVGSITVEDFSSVPVTGFIAPGGTISIPSGFDIMMATPTVPADPSEFGIVDMNGCLDGGGFARCTVWRNPTGALTVSFAIPVNVVGFVFNDVWDTNTISVSIDGGATIGTISGTGVTGTSVQPYFAGIVNDMSTITSVTFVGAQAGDGVSLKEVQFGAVPAPGPWAVFGSLALVWAVLRYQRKPRVA